MTTPIPVHAREDDRDTFTVEFSFRLKVLDAATGEPVTDAYAMVPTVDQQVLDRRDVHPFGVLNPRSITITHGELADFSFDVRDLRTWTASATASGGKALSPTWKCTGEFIHPAEPPETLVTTDGASVFERIHADDERYVCVASAGTDYARRSLVTNREGILEIPLSFKDWVVGTDVRVRLRDHFMLQAIDAREPQALTNRATAGNREGGTNGHRELGVELRNQPTANEWWSKLDADEQQFQEEITFAQSPVEWEDIDATVWVVRKMRNASELVSDDLLPAPTSSYTGPSGIVIHYNSGYFMSEKRGSANKLCREAFTDGDNDYMMRVEMALWILKRINGTNGTLGYHYHIDAHGNVYQSRDDAHRANHAGHSREPTTLVARQNGGSATTSHTHSNPRSWLNSKYIGIDVLGNHRAGYHFADHQHWYLDRLIENIRSRDSDIEWYDIAGHDEVRAAWNAANPSNTKNAKADPGAALDGGAQGMELLRGRHGAAF